MNRWRQTIRRSRAGIWLLGLLLLRAYIPVGFMPAAGAPFQLELCPGVGFAMPAQHLHHHAGTHSDFANCPFGSAPASGPLSHHLDPSPVVPEHSGPILSYDSVRIVLREQHVHQPRGPPSLA
jgi:hypothetical protein